MEMYTRSSIIRQYQGDTPFGMRGVVFDAYSVAVTG
jgi:hypothetical protein